MSKCVICLFNMRKKKDIFTTKLQPEGNKMNLWLIAKYNFVNLFLQRQVDVVKTMYEL